MFLSFNCVSILEIYASIDTKKLQLSYLYKAETKMVLKKILRECQVLNLMN